MRTDATSFLSLSFKSMKSNDRKRREMNPTERKRKKSFLSDFIMEQCRHKMDGRLAGGSELLSCRNRSKGDLYGSSHGANGGLNEANRIRSMFSKKVEDVTVRQSNGDSPDSSGEEEESSDERRKNPNKKTSMAEELVEDRTALLLSKKESC